MVFKVIIGLHEVTGGGWQKMYDAAHHATGLRALNRERLSDLLGNDRLGIAEILEIGLDAIADLTARLRTALARDMWEDAKAAAHELKGVCANIGAEELADIGARFQTALSRSAPRASTSLKDVDGMNAALERFQQDAKEYLASLTLA
jgi:HPt (histidine-containing phosphotransfer) domain-containing protein